jgi:phage FluMu gp28-like protein
MHLVTGPDIETESGLSRYLCPFQIEGVLCDSRYQYTEKANRIGWTWLDALRNVRRRLAQPGRDYLFTTQNWNGALEYGRYLDFWINIYNLGKFVISKTEETITTRTTNERGETLALQEKVGVYKFDGGSRIILFSSSPWGIQTFEGDVGWDEAAFHDQQEKMWAAIATRLQWGFDVSVWSAHNGIGSWFNQVLGKLAKAPGSGWLCRKVTIYDAIEDGLVERINQRAGTNMTREEFLADCRKRALTPAIFAERFECNPSDAGSSIVPWSVVERSRVLDSITRAHLGDHEIRELFGSPSMDTKFRDKLMKQWMHTTFEDLAAKEKMRIGFDIAASGQGDLASLWIDAKTSRGLEHRGLLTTQTEDWDFLTVALMWFMQLPDAKGAGDSTGLGRQITWTAEQRCGGRFIGVPFSRNSKSEMGSRLMAELTSGQCLLAREEHDVAMDIFALQKQVVNNTLVFTESANPLNAASHCDMAWSKALASHADSGAGNTFSSAPLNPTKGRQSRLARFLGW